MKKTSIIFILIGVAAGIAGAIALKSPKVRTKIADCAEKLANWTTNMADKVLNQDEGEAGD